MSGAPPTVLDDVSVVIPTLGRPVLARALAAIGNGTALPSRVIVVDQSSDPAIERIVIEARERRLDVEYLPSRGRGRAAGVNRGIERVETRFLAITDDDCLVEPGWLAALRARLHAMPEALVTGRVEASGEERVAVVATSRERRVQRRPRLTFDSLSGGNMGASAEVMRRIGLLDEDPRIATAEDAELAYRALRLGVPLVYEPDAGVAHIGWRDEDERGRQYDSYARSHGGFYGKYLRRGDMFIAARALLHTVRAARRWGKGVLGRDRELARNGRAYALGMFGGMRAGWKRTPPTSGPGPARVTVATPAADRGRVAVLVLTMNQRERTLEALDTLEQERTPGIEILVWDNGSTDGTQDAIEARFPHVHVVHQGENLGVAGGRNAAAEAAIERWDPDFLLFLDNDMLVEPGFVDALREPFHGESRLAQTQAKLRFMDEPDLLNDGGGFEVRWWLGRTEPIGYREVDRGQRDDPRECIPCGGAMMVRANVFRELGGFDESFNPFGPEDLDFSLRVRAAGHSAVYVPRAVAYHAVSHTFEGGDYSELYARHKARNWLVLLRRHAPLHQQAGFLLLGAPWALAQMLRREGWSGGKGALRGWLRGIADLTRSD